MSDGFKPPSPISAGVAPTEGELCAYVAEMCGELRTLSRRPSFRTLNYLLDMARLEAERMAKDRRTGSDTSQPSRGE